MQNKSMFVYIIMDRMQCDVKNDQYFSANHQ